MLWRHHDEIERFALSLAELAELAGGLDYTAVGAAVSRFHRRWPQDAQLRRIMKQIQTQLSIIEI